MNPTSATAIVQNAHAYGDATLVVLRGEIDMLTAPGLTQQLSALTDAGRPDLLIDLLAVDFCDSSGIRALEDVRDRVAARQGRIRLICTRPSVLYLLHHPRIGLDVEVLDRLPLPAPPRTKAQTKAQAHSSD